MKLKRLKTERENTFQIHTLFYIWSAFVSSIALFIGILEHGLNTITISLIILNIFLYTQTYFQEKNFKKIFNELSEKIISNQNEALSIQMYYEKQKMLKNIIISYHSILKKEFEIKQKYEKILKIKDNIEKKI